MKVFVTAVLSVLAFGIVALAPVSDGRAQPLSNLQAGLEESAVQGRTIYRLEQGARTIVYGGIVVPQGVTLDLNDGELIAILGSEDIAGVRLLTGSTLKNGTVSVVSKGKPGSQAGIHAAVLIGALYGENPSATIRSKFDSPSDWAVKNVTLSSDKVESAAALQVVGGAHRGFIERVSIPDSERLAAGIMLDWGTVGPIFSSDIKQSSMAYRAGLAYTTHPYDITIRDIRIGRLSRPLARGGSFGLRLSGVRDVDVDNVVIGSVTEAGIYHTAGDLGFEFARPSDGSRAHLGIRIAHVDVLRADGAYMFRSDSFADNIARAVANGYRPMRDPIATTDMQITDMMGAAGGGQSNFGLRIDHQRGGRFSNITARGFRRGFYIDEQAYDIRFRNLVSVDSVEAAMSVGHPYRPPSGIVIEGVRATGAARLAQTILIGRSDHTDLRSASATEVRIARSARNTSVPPGLRTIVE